MDLQTIRADELKHGDVVHFRGTLVADVTGIDIDAYRVRVVLDDGWRQSFRANQLVRVESRG